MKNLKKLTAVSLTVAMLAAFSGCGDQSWSYKSGDTSLAAGVYIYNLLNGYYEGLKSQLEHMCAMGLSSPERQRGIRFVEDLDGIRRILGEGAPSGQGAKEGDSR